MRTNFEEVSQQWLLLCPASRCQLKLSLEGAKQAGSGCRSSALSPLLRSVPAASRNCVPNPSLPPAPTNSLSPNALQALLAPSFKMQQQQERE